MPRSPSPPPLPDSPAKWLANFRYRLLTEKGERLSPEALGYQLGVSGATVRRWEAGLSNPGEDDLHRFADICALTHQQREFLHRLYARNSLSRPASPSLFRSEVMKVLNVQRPAFVADELFYIRAWNSYFTSYAGHLAKDLAHGLNAMHIAFEVGKQPDPVDEDERIGKIIRLLWMWTAHMAPYPAYSDLIRTLLKNDMFVHHWQAIINESGSEHSPPLVMPVIERRYGEASYVVYMGEVLFPPLYRVFVFEPTNEHAAKQVQDGLASGPPAFQFAGAHHWAE